MAIAYRNTGGVVTGSTSLSITMPPFVPQDDVMVMTVCTHQPSISQSVPSGWTVFAKTSSTNGTGFFAWKRAGGSEAGPYSVTGLADSSCGAIMSFSGCRLIGSPIDQSTGRANYSNGTGTGGVVTSEDNCMLISAACVMNNYALSAWNSGSPGTLTERFDGRTPTGSNTGVGAATVIKPTAGEVVNTTYTIATWFENVGLCCSLLPAVDTQIVMQSVDHAHATDGALTLAQQEAAMVLSDATHAHDVDNVALDVMLTVADSTHAHAVDVPTIVHNIVFAVYTHLFFWLIASPAIGGIPGPKIPNGCNVTEISSYVTGAGKTVAFNIEERTDQDSAGTNVLAADQTADDNGTSATTFANKYLAKDNFLWVDISAADAGAENVAITIAALDETVLELANSNHGHNADNIAFTQAHDLTVQSSDHAHAVGNIVLEQADPDLVAANSNHANTSSAITLTENQVAIDAVPGFWTWVVETPGVVGIPGPKVPDGCRVVSIQSYTTTDISVTFNVEQRDTIAVTGTDIMAADQVAIITGALAIDPENRIVVAGNYLWLDVSAVSASTGCLMVTVGYVTASVLSVEPCTHGHTCDNVALDVDLVVANSTHAHAAGAVVIAEDQAEIGLNVPGFYTWTLANPQVGVVPGPKIFNDLKIREISSYVTAGTSATFNVESRGDHSLSGVNVLASDQVADIDGTSEIVPDFYVPKDRWLCLDTSAVSWLDQLDPPETTSLLTVTVSWEYSQGGVANCDHALTSDNVDLVADEDITLTVAASSHANTADSPTLSPYLRNSVPMELIVTPVMLVVANSTHAHTTTSVTVTGGTKIYLPSSGASSVSPGLPTFWDEADHDTINATIVKGTTALLDKTSTTQNFVSTTVLNRMYVLGDGVGLSAHHYTTSETFNLVVRCAEEIPEADCTLAFTINAFDITGVTHYGSIYSGVVNAVEFSTSLQSRYCSGVTLGDVDAPGEHILVFGLGSYASNATGDEYIVTLNFGDLPASALDMSNADTGTDYPYIELPTIQLSAYSVSLTVADVTHAHTAGEITLELGLAIDNCTHAHDCENVTMSGVNYTLVVANCAHAHSGGSVDFPITEPGRRLWVKSNGHWIQITPATG